ncbi:MAG TPA: glycosyltransferase family 1 protein, partial [Candidatus Doudnabacteria bacterium]|nr:glycosyltransferase family 1 protein [Candidatus Doudnabacteria bacterium]
MTIGFDFRMGGSINAGIGRYSFELLCGLLSQNKSGHKFVVFYHEHNNSPEDIKKLEQLGAELVPANFRHYSFGEQLLFPRLLAKFKLDLMHFPNFNVPILYRSPYVVTIHDLVHHKLSGHKKARYWKYLAYKFIINRAINNARRVITITEAARQEIQEHFPKAREQLTVIYEAPTRYSEQGVDFEKIAKQFLLERPYLLFVGTLERKKNTVLLAKGFDRFISKYKYDIDLVIVGRDDPHYPEIRSEMLMIKHADNLVFTGFVADSVQATLYKNAFAFITASLHEGFGLPGLEAMEYGVPVLAANTPVFNEVYDNAAIFFDATNSEDIADKINLLVSDQPFYEEMQKKGLHRSNQFDWRLTAKKTL